MNCLAEALALLALAVPARAAFKDKELFDMAAPPLSQEVLRGEVAGLSNRSEDNHTIPLVLTSFQSLTSDLAHLKQQMDALRDQKSLEVSVQRAKFQQQLMYQDHENSAIYAQNLEIMGSIQGHQRRLQHLRSTAADIEKDSRSLERALRGLSENASAAKDFINEVLKQPDGLSSPEAKVLAEVSAQKEIMKRKRSKEQRLREIDEAGARSTMYSHSLLQLDSDTALWHSSLKVYDAPLTEPDAPLAVMHSLRRSMAGLLSQHNQTMSELEVVFLETFKHGGQVREQLLGKQAELNATQKALLSLKPRLDAAVALTKNTRAYLHSRLSALRSFVGTLGKWPAEVRDEHVLAIQLGMTDRPALPKPVPLSTPGNEEDADDFGTALLQVDSAGKIRGAHELLLGLDDLNPVPYSNLMVDMNLEAMSQDFASKDRMQQESKDDKRVGYSKELLQMNTESLKRAKANAQIVSSLSSVKADNRRMLSEAHMIRKEIKLLRNDLNGLQLNLSIAMEFAAETLRKSNTSASPELAVVKMLSEREAEENAQRQHEQQIAEVGQLLTSDIADEDGRLAPQEDAKRLDLENLEGYQAVGLLQTGVERRDSARMQLNELLELRRHRHSDAPSGPLPTKDAEIVASLDEIEARIHQVSANRHESEHVFEEEFQSRFDSSSIHHDKLTEEGEELARRRRSMEEFRDRLSLAVNHLDGIHRELLLKAAQVRNFLRSLGPVALPHSAPTSLP